MKRMFKKIWLYFLLIAIVSIQQLSAQTLKEFFNSSEVPLTYLGIDFTHTKIFNESPTGLEWRDQHIPAINAVVLKDTTKFEFKKVFTRSVVINDISTSDARNAKIDAAKIIGNGNDEVKLSASDIQSIANGYKSGKKGIGLLFIMENINKAKVEASLHVALIDLTSGKVLVTERMVEKPAGFGLKNYWVRPVRNALDEIKKSKYNEWKASVK